MINVNKIEMPCYLLNQLTIRVSNVPSLAGLKCYVHGKEHSTTTVGPGNELKCRTPPEKDLPSITSDNGIYLLYALK